MMVQTSLGKDLPASAIARGPTVPRGPLVGYLLQIGALDSQVLGHLIVSAPQQVLSSVFTVRYHGHVVIPIIDAESPNSPSCEPAAVGTAGQRTVPPRDA